MKEPSDWDNDEWAAFFLAIGLGGPLLLSRFVDLGPWLQRHGILVDPAEALITVPGLGGFDAVRLLLVAAAVVLLAVLILGAARRARATKVTQ